MTGVAFTVNGKPVSAQVDPRTHLADFLRDERLLTGTHLGCEHGVCGACTILVDGAPARSCITLAVACDGAEIHTIEDFDADPVMARLRAAFTAAHALQCGYCTPGMLATARDIVLRLPDADEPRVRLELSGNLCRCTGYAGVVRAILAVLAERRADPADFVSPRRPALPVLPEPTAVTARPSPTSATAPGMAAVDLPATPDTVWALLRDPAAVASCLPGASLDAAAPDGRLTGHVAIAFGPIRARFAGEAMVRYDDLSRQGEVEGRGRDAGGSAAQGTLHFVVTPQGDGTRLATRIDYRLTGPLAQFGRSALVADFIQALLESFAANLSARLTGSTAVQAELRLAGLLWRALRRRLLALLRR